MGRLSLVIGCVAPLFGASACETHDPSPSLQARSEAVLASSAPAAGPLEVAAAGKAPPHLSGRDSGVSSSSAEFAAPAGKRNLCERQIAPFALVADRWEVVQAKGASSLPLRLPPLAGHWTWLSFWAAYCGPCKEEMPRLLEWQRRLSSGAPPVQLHFVSLDDDKRQVLSFLAEQPEGGLRNTAWLPDGPLRDGWLTHLRRGLAPSLPFHVLVDTRGQVVCTIEGELEASDFPQLSAIFAKL